MRILELTVHAALLGEIAIPTPPLARGYRLR